MNKFLKFGVPVCIVTLIFSFVILNNIHVSLNKTALDGNITAENKLNINKIDNMGLTRMDADIKEISSNEQMIPWPDFLKSGITIPNDLDKTDIYAIYTRKDENDDYNNLNCYVYTYYNTELNKKIRMAFSDTQKPIRDYLFESNGKLSKINNIELTIYQYDNSYFATFRYKDYNFDIETTNINMEELNALLESIIK